MKPKRQSEEPTSHPLESQVSPDEQVLRAAPDERVLRPAPHGLVLRGEQNRTLDFEDSTKLDVQNDLGR